ASQARAKRLAGRLACQSLIRVVLPKPAGAAINTSAPGWRRAALSRRGSRARGTKRGPAPRGGHLWAGNTGGGVTEHVGGGGRGGAWVWRGFRPHTYILTPSHTGFAPHQPLGLLGQLRR